MEKKIKTIEEHYYNLTKSSEFDENKKKFNQKELDEINQGVIERLYIKEVEKQLEKNNVPKLHYTKKTHQTTQHSGKSYNPVLSSGNIINSDYTSQRVQSTDNKINVSDIEEITK